MLSQVRNLFPWFATVTLFVEEARANRWNNDIMPEVAPVFRERHHLRSLMFVARALRRSLQRASPSSFTHVCCKSSEAQLKKFQKKGSHYPAVMFVGILLQYLLHAHATGGHVECVTIFVHSCLLQGVGHAGATARPMASVAIFVHACLLQ